eukprot:CAMPEP_0182424348 /NCGR_PEP_ID=MMETSP1167-20130531/10556_1 /TAXON_ID=2988 /ORGANISM="Mallomonas Sp, Strain CCMP3275" /LENGTH=296 /DNA_ID=CAMNT_0024604103 /DNA_START=143 /DNA_END=1033 /DNA_ORIENTATION=-
MSLRASSKEELVAAQKDLFDLVEKQNCNPILIRLAWHDAGTYDDKIGAAAFPKCGGANGSIRFDPELAHGANAGLKIALNLLGSIKKKHENVGWADLMQMASAVAVEHAGGPKIPMKYGRVDAVSAEECSPEGNLPNAAAPFGDGTNTPQDHLRKVFYRMGLSDKDIVALSGAHTLGRAWKNRSGFGAENGTKFTTGDVTPRADGKPGYGTKGGTSWTQKWLAFDNSYFTELMLKDSDPELLKLDTDKILLGDESFRPLCETYAKDSAAFFADYAVSHAKLSELGVKWSPEGGITL